MVRVWSFLRVRAAPQALFFLAGCGQTALTQSPGDGFATDANTIKALNLSDPTPFFKTLLLRPYVNQARAPCCPALLVWECQDPHSACSGVHHILKTKQNILL